MCYQSFLTHQQLKEEAHRFLQDGEFTGDVGDLVLPALVNVLAIPMAVFTSAENMPVRSLLPITSMVMESEPIFLAYLHEGPGHYDAVIRDDKENIEPLELTSGTTKCTYGRKATKGFHVLLRRIATVLGVHASKQIKGALLSVDAKDATILMVQDQSYLIRHQVKKGETTIQLTNSRT